MQAIEAIVDMSFRLQRKSSHLQWYAYERKYFVAQKFVESCLRYASVPGNNTHACALSSQHADVDPAPNHTTATLSMAKEMRWPTSSSLTEVIVHVPMLRVICCGSP
eukprot:1160452-Pelagomonas_calceolata.AAC.5